MQDMTGTRADRHQAPDCMTGVLHTDFLCMFEEDVLQSESLIPATISILEERIAANDREILPQGQSFKMNITVKDFMQRIAKYSNASACCYAIGLILLERLKKDRPDTPLLTSKNYQRLVLIAIMCASKYLDDHYYSNKHWAQIGGISTKELNQIEVDFLGRLGWRLHIQREEYDWYCEELYSKADEFVPSEREHQDDDLSSQGSHSSTKHSSASSHPSNPLDGQQQCKVFLPVWQQEDDTMSAMSTPPNSFTALPLTGIHSRGAVIPLMNPKGMQNLHWRQQKPPQPQHQQLAFWHQPQQQQQQQNVRPPVQGCTQFGFLGQVQFVPVPPPQQVVIFRH